MFFSLIVCTINRKNELEFLFSSLKKQTYTEFEIILIDQNPDGLIEEIVLKYQKDIRINHVKTRTTGLSVARNIGIKKVTGDIVAFTDDDCTYPSSLLENLSEEFIPEIEGLIGWSMTPEGEPSFKYQSDIEELNKKNIWNAISYTVFLRKSVINTVGFFDESLGIGSNGPYQSGEETDYLLRCLDKKFKFYFRSNLKVIHPKKRKIFKYDRYVRHRAYGYAMGKGRILKRYNFPIVVLLNFLVRPFVKAMLSLMVFRGNEFLYYFGVFRGRIIGIYSTRTLK